MLKSLQAGRAIAALAVAAFHLSSLRSLPQYGGIAPLHDFTDHGTLGVDFFFVLSGFIIAYAHGKDIGRPGRWRNYVVKRVTRIYPLYWILSAVMIVSIVTGLGSTPLPAGESDWLTTILLVHFSPFIPPLQQSWTLFYEIMFYALFSLAILDRRLGLAALVMWIATIALLSRHQGEDTVTGNFAAAINFDFILGMAAAAIFPRLGKIGAPVLGVAGIVLLAALLWLDRSGHWSAPLQAAYGLSFAAIVASAAALEIRGLMPPMPVLTMLGNASYSIYLVHVNVESHLLRAFSAAHAESLVGQTGLSLVVFALTIVSACAIYLVVEKPLMAGLRARIHSPRPIAVGASSVARG